MKRPPLVSVHRSVRLRLPGLLGVLVLAAPAVAVGPDDDFFTVAAYRLLHDDGGYRLRPTAGPDLAVPTAWLEPPEVVAADEETYVSALEWAPEVTSFAIGEGRIGLHLSSYAIQEEGSAQAAAGRDLYLILEPRTGALRRGLDLGDSKGRVRLGGCFAAWFQRVYVGDVDCDGVLDLATVEERIHCALADDQTAIEWPVYTRGPLRWHHAEEGGWVARPDLDGRLPCRGLRQAPLTGISKGPVDFILERYAGQSPLPER